MPRSSLTPRQQFRVDVRQFRDESCEQLAAIGDKSSPRAIELQSTIDEMDRMLIATDDPELDRALETPMVEPHPDEMFRKRF